MLVGARPEAVARALGDSLGAAFQRWHEWATRQRDFILNGKPGVSQDAIARQFAAVGINIPTT